MPELPEVETITRELREAGILGLQINKAIIFWNKTIAIPESHFFSKRIQHQTIKGIERRGKFIVFCLSQDYLLVHLRMTGKFLIGKENAPPNNHERVRLFLSSGIILHYEDQRKFGKWYLVSSLDEILATIGIEPLSSDFTLSAFKTLLKGKKQKIKPFLLNQSYIAGIGNIYADEALWMAKIHPLRTVNSLSANEIRKLHESIIIVLTRGVENTGTSLGSTRANYFSVSGRRGGNQSHLNVFRQDGMPCKRCKAIIQKIVVGQRGTHYCPFCQNINFAHIDKA